MTIVVNDQPRRLPDMASIASLLTELKLDKQPCAVEVNKRLVAKSAHAETQLADGDRVEIVTLVGGG